MARMGTSSARLSFTGLLLCGMRSVTLAEPYPSTMSAMRRCFVCPGDGDEPEAWSFAPAHAERCVQFIVEAPTVCSDLLTEERLRAEKDKRMAELKELEASKGWRAVSEKRWEVAYLWSTLRKVSNRKTEQMWAKLTEAMDDSATEMVSHGLGQEAGQMLAATEIVRGARQSPFLRKGLPRAPESPAERKGQVSPARWSRVATEPLDSQEDAALDSQEAAEPAIDAGRGGYGAAMPAIMLGGSVGATLPIMHLPKDPLYDPVFDV